MTKLCSCGSCEDMNERMFAFTEKMMLDGECVMAMIGTGYAMRTIAINLLESQLRGTLQQQKVPPVLAELFAVPEMDRILNSIEASMQQSWEANVDKYCDRLNELVLKAIAKQTEEDKLPKGT